jgi:hypothetical protein
LTLLTSAPMAQVSGSTLGVDFRFEAGTEAGALSANRVVLVMAFLVPVWLVFLRRSIGSAPS